MLESGDPTPGEGHWRTMLGHRTTIAELDSVAVGYCHAQVFGADGYVRHVVVDPHARGNGVGRALLDDAMARMREAGCERWRLNVRHNNVPAIVLYRSLGLRRSHGCATVDFAWSLVNALPDPETPLHVFEPAATQATALERTFELPMGQVASALTDTRVHVRAIFEPDGLAVALFTPSAPVVFPFRAQTIAAAVALLRALRPLATQETVRVVVEDDEPLERALTTAGARVALRFVHMRGVL